MKSQYKLTKTMKKPNYFSIQVAQEDKTWEECPAVVHKNFQSRQEAVIVAYAISRQCGRATVRLVELPNPLPDMGDMTLTQYVCRCSGGYFNDNNIDKYGEHGDTCFPVW